LDVYITIGNMEGTLCFEAHRTNKVPKNKDLEENVWSVR